MPTVDHGELVDREPVVGLRPLVVDDLRLRAAIEPSGRRYSTVTPSTSIRWSARLRSMSVGPATRVSLRNASSTAAAGSAGLRRASAPRSRRSRMTSRYPGSPRSAAGVPTALSGPWRTVQPSRPRTASAASSTIDSVKVVTAPARPKGSRHPPSTPAASVRLGRDAGTSIPVRTPHRVPAVGRTS